LEHEVFRESADVPFYGLVQYLDHDPIKIGKSYLGSGLEIS
jgi:hypothetical protein